MAAIETKTKGRMDSAELFRAEVDRINKAVGIDTPEGLVRLMRLKIEEQQLRRGKRHEDKEILDTLQRMNPFAPVNPRDGNVFAIHATTSSVLGQIRQALQSHLDSIGPTPKPIDAEPAESKSLVVTNDTVRCRLLAALNSNRPTVTAWTDSLCDVAISVFTPMARMLHTAATASPRAMRVDESLQHWVSGRACFIRKMMKQKRHYIADILLYFIYSWVWDTKLSPITKAGFVVDSIAEARRYHFDFVVDAFAKAEPTDPMSVLPRLKAIADRGAWPDYCGRKLDKRKRSPAEMKEHDEQRFKSGTAPVAFITTVQEWLKDDNAMAEVASRWTARQSTAKAQQRPLMEKRPPNRDRVKKRNAAKRRRRAAKAARDAATETEIETEPESGWEEVKPRKQKKAKVTHEHKGEEKEHKSRVAIGISGGYDDDAGYEDPSPSVDIGISGDDHKQRPQSATLSNLKLTAAPKAEFKEHVDLEGITYTLRREPSSGDRRRVLDEYYKRCPRDNLDIVGTLAMAEDFIFNRHAQSHDGNVTKPPFDEAWSEIRRQHRIHSVTVLENASRQRTEGLYCGTRWALGHAQTAFDVLSRLYSNIEMGRWNGWDEPIGITEGSHTWNRLTKEAQNGVFLSIAKHTDSLKVLVLLGSGDGTSKKWLEAGGHGHVCDLLGFFQCGMTYSRPLEHGAFYYMDSSVRDPEPAKRAVEKLASDVAGCIQSNMALDLTTAFSDDSRSILEDPRVMKHALAVLKRSMFFAAVSTATYHSTKASDEFVTRGTAYIPSFQCFIPAEIVCDSKRGMEEVNKFPSVTMGSMLDEFRKSAKVYMTVAALFQSSVAAYMRHTARVTIDQIAGDIWAKIAPNGPLASWKPVTLARNASENKHKSGISTADEWTREAIQQLRLVSTSKRSPFPSFRTEWGMLAQDCVGTGGHFRVGEVYESVMRLAPSVNGVSIRSMLMWLVRDLLSLNKVLTDADPVRKNQIASSMVRVIDRALDAWANLAEEFHQVFVEKRLAQAKAIIAQWGEPGEFPAGATLTNLKRLNMAVWANQSMGPHKSQTSEQLCREIMGEEPLCMHELIATANGAWEALFVLQPGSRAFSFMQKLTQTILQPMLDKWTRYALHGTPFAMTK